MLNPYIRRNSMSACMLGRNFSSCFVESSKTLRIYNSSLPLHFWDSITYINTFNLHSLEILISLYKQFSKVLKNVLSNNLYSKPHWRSSHSIDSNGWRIFHSCILTIIQWSHSGAPHRQRLPSQLRTTSIFIILILIVFVFILHSWWCVLSWHWAALGWHNHTN